VLLPHVRLQDSSHIVTIYLLLKIFRCKVMQYNASCYIINALYILLSETIYNLGIYSQNILPIIGHSDSHQRNYIQSQCSQSNSQYKHWRPDKEYTCRGFFEIDSLVKNSSAERDVLFSSSLVLSTTLKPGLKLNVSVIGSIRIFLQNWYRKLTLQAWGLIIIL